MLEAPYQTYFGGKNGSGVYHTIINQIRPHVRYWELFVGNGAVFRAKKPAQQNLINDLNTDVVNAWLASTIDKTDYPISVTNQDAISLLRNYEPIEGRTVIYLDPPYPLSSRKQKREVYDCEMSDSQHIELLTAAKQVGPNTDVLISTYANPIYKDILADWNLITFQATTRQGVATEYLYMNYEPDGTLHDYRYLGKDFTDRQRIKRKIEREVSRLQRLPMTERNAIIASIIDRADYETR